MPYFPADQTLYLNAKTDLIKVSLVKRVKEDNQLMLHRLVPDVIQAHMAATEALEIFQFAVSLVLRAWPTSFLHFDHFPATWVKLEELLRHVLKLQQAYQRHTPWIIKSDTD